MAPMSLDRSSARAIVQDTLDALVDHAAMLGPAGEVIIVNQAWAAHAAQAGVRGSCTGVPYRDLLAGVAGVATSEVPAAARGIERVLSGEMERFELDYRCEVCDDEHWSRMSVHCVPRRD